MGTSRSYAVELKRSPPVHLPPHPERPDTTWRRWALEQRGPRAVDLFCGCGGLSLGLEQAGWSVILAVDNDRQALETHRHNFPGSALDFDLSDKGRLETLVCLLSGIPVDLIAGGPPCQPFSRAGRSKIRSLVEEGSREAEDVRRELWQGFLFVVEQVRPRAVLLENVPDMALGDDLRVLRRMLGRLEAAGYRTDAALVDAWRHGVPQHRQRLFMVGLREGSSFEWPAERKPLKLRQVLDDLPSLDGSQGARELPYGGPRTPFQRVARQGMQDSRVVWDHMTRPVREDDRRAFKLMKPGTRYTELPAELRRYRGDIFDDKYNRLDWDGLSRSITAHIAKDGYWYIHPEEARTLTVREAARIQTFPDRFRFAGTRSHAFAQIGNAVPPALGQAMGAAVLRALKRRGKPRVDVPAIREHLLEWARVDAQKAPWRHPGDTWAILAGVVLDPRPPTGAGSVKVFLDQFPQASVAGDGISAAQARKLKLDARRVRRLVRVARELGASRGRWSAAKWAKAAGLNLSEQALVRVVGLAEDLVLTSAPAVRAAGRLLGRNFEQRPLSEGRIAVGRIVGGRDVAALNAALAALGSLLCTAQEPACGKCPVRRMCLTKMAGAA